MKLLKIKGFILGFTLIASFTSCSKNSDIMKDSKSQKIVFLHHSTGGVIINANSSRILRKLGFQVGMNKLFSNYNKQNGTSYSFTAQHFPKASPYGWNNYPFDYYNIWVKNAGENNYLKEPTLEILTKEYDVIIFKHCFPVSNIAESDSFPSIDSAKKTVENYKLQYQALKEKLHQFPDTKFLLWTGAALVQGATNEAEALRAKEFFTWVTTEWDQPGDNIYIWDFKALETEGGLYLKPENAVSVYDSHPSISFAKKVQPIFFKRLIDVIEGNGDTDVI